MQSNKRKKWKLARFNLVLTKTARIVKNSNNQHLADLPINQKIN